MGSSLNLDLSRLEWRGPGGESPISAQLVGGRPDYGSVARLPDKLWHELGIVVVDLVNHPTEFKARTDLAIVLADLGGSRVAEAAREWADTVVVGSSSWSKLALKLNRVQSSLKGEHFAPPESEPEAKSEPEAETKPEAETRPEPSTLNLDNLHWEGVDEAELIKWLDQVYKQKGYSQRELAEAIGRTPTWVAIRLRIAAAESNLLYEALSADYSPEGPLFTVNQAVKLVRKHRNIDEAVKKLMAEHQNSSNRQEKDMGTPDAEEFEQRLQSLETEEFIRVIARALKKRREIKELAFQKREDGGVAVTITETKTIVA